VLYKFAIDKEKNHLGTYQDNQDDEVPRGFTSVPIWTVPNGIVLIFDGTMWTEATDHRGDVYYYKRDGQTFTWNLIRVPTVAELEEITDISPTQNNPVWDVGLNDWREMTQDEINIYYINRLGLKVISLLGTEWEYTESKQWAVQLAENQATHWGKKVLVYDAYNALHRLSRANSNKLQTAMFNKMMADKGITS